MRESLQLVSIAEVLIQRSLSPVPHLHLLRTVMGFPESDLQVRMGRTALSKSRWVKILAEEQWEDGSWGRLHSRDTSRKQKIPTTEIGVLRSLALGLTKHDPMLAMASKYLQSVLHGDIDVVDRPESNNRWKTGVRLFAAATLAMIEPEAPALDRIWEVWCEIATRSFASGGYDAQDESRAHQDLTGASVTGSYLSLNNPYTLRLLASRSGSLPELVERSLLAWLFGLPEGIRTFEQKLNDPPALESAGRLDRWFSSHALLAKFPGWRRHAAGAVQWIWKQRTEEGIWDFGARVPSSTVLPYSESWRRAGAREVDWTVRVLLLLRHFYPQ